MKRVEISIEEKVRYTSSIVFEVPDDFDEKKLNLMLDELERKSESTIDVARLLEKSGFKVLEKVESFPYSPDDAEIEIFDYEFI